MEKTATGKAGLDPVFAALEEDAFTARPLRRSVVKMRLYNDNSINRLSPACVAFIQLAGAKNRFHSSVTRCLLFVGERTDRDVSVLIGGRKTRSGEKK